MQPCVAPCSTSVCFSSTRGQLLHPLFSKNGPRFPSGHSFGIIFEHSRRQRGRSPRALAAASRSGTRVDTNNGTTPLAPRVARPMWVRKTDEQIVRGHRGLWLSFSGPLLWFLLLFVCAIGRTLEGPFRPVQRWPETWPEILCRALVFAATASLLVYVLQLAVRRKIYPVNGKVVICDRCHRVTRPTRARKCTCGGDFDNFDNWTWIDDQGDSGQVTDVE